MDLFVDSVKAFLSANDIYIAYPEMILVMLLIPYFLLMRMKSLADLPMWQQGFSTFVRLMVVFCLALGIARVSSIVRQKKVCTVFLVDLSGSIPDEAVKQAGRFVAEAWRKRGENKVYLVTFAERPRVIPIPKSAGAKWSPKLKRHKKSHGSDLQAALHRAYGLFPPGYIKRVVLLSDGIQTRGNLIGESLNARKYGVKIFTRALTAPEYREVLVKAMHLPQTAYRGESFKIKTEIFATHPQKVTLALYKNEVVVPGFPRGVTLKKGLNEFNFPTRCQDSGTATYRLSMAVKKEMDKYRMNNRYVAAVHVKGKPRVLLLEGGSRYQARYLKGALEKSQIDVEIRGRYGVPRSIRDLNQYDLVIMSDLPAFDMRDTYVRRKQMKLLQSYVKKFGGGFIMVGGLSSFGMGGYSNTIMEKILPVRFDVEKKHDKPSLAMVLAIDKSGSMSGTKIELAKDAAKATVELLGSQDKVGIVAFDSRAHSLVKLQSVRNRAHILSDIARLTASGGTSIYAPLELAYQELATTRAKIKHVILLTDGQASNTGIAELVQNMSAESITVSTVGVGRGSARRLLSMIADLGNGRSYYTNDAYSIPKIFTKETSTVTRSAVVDLPFRPKVVKRVQMLRGIDFDKAPYLLGYVATKPKPKGEVLMVSDYHEPILARWRYGMGKTAAFTSDAKNRWAQEWVSWKGFVKFWSQVARDMMRRRFHRTFAMRTWIVKGRAHISIDAVDKMEQYVNALNSELTIIDPKLAKKRLPLMQVAPGRYEGSFELKRFGAYILSAEHRQGRQLIAASRGAVSRPFPAEYLVMNANRKLLKRVSEVTNGRFGVSPGETTAWLGEEQIAARRELWPYFIAFALLLLLLDLALRRIRLGRARETILLAGNDDGDR